MKNTKYRNKNISRILATLLIVCVFLAMFSGCTFGSDTCTDPNCTSCANVVYAEEYSVSCDDPECSECVVDYNAISSTYVDCPDCTLGGEYVTTTSLCSTCGGDGVCGSYVKNDCETCGGDGYANFTITCTACNGTGQVECSNCNGLGYYDVEEQGTGTLIRYTCAECGGSGGRIDAVGSTTGTGYVDCTICGGDGLYDTSRCQDCNGSGSVYEWTTWSCTAANCDDGVVSKTTWVECSTCYGEMGWYVEDGDEPCDYCGYSELITCYDCNGLGYYDVQEQGTGTTIRYTCSTCGGDGGRIDAVGSTTGSGKITCPYCTDISYATITFITNYDTTETVTATVGEAIPTYRSMSADSYWISTDSDGANPITKSTIVAGDMTIYVWFYGFEEDDTTSDVEKYYVYFHEYDDGWWIFGSWEPMEYVYVTDGATFAEIDSDYVSSSYNLYYDQYEKYPVALTDVITDNMLIYAIAVDVSDSNNPDGSDSIITDGINGFLSDLFGADISLFDSDSIGSTILSVVIIIGVVIIGILLLYVLFKVIIAIFK